MRTDFFVNSEKRRGLRLLITNFGIISGESSTTSALTFGEIAHAQHNLSELSFGFA